MSTYPGSHFRQEPVGRELRIRLMCACGATVRFMAEAEKCSKDAIRAIIWKFDIQGWKRVIKQPENRVRVSRSKPVHETGDTSCPSDSERAIQMLQSWSLGRLGERKRSERESPSSEQVERS